jgi:L-methionine (R)-S-oxide reductase
MEYEKILKKIDKIIQKNKDSKYILEEIVKILYQKINHYNWVGIYIVEKDDLILGPWRGEQATEHTKIPVGKGVCGSAAATGKTEIVPNVKEDNRYLECFIGTKSEIVVPIKKDGRILAEIDIDSNAEDAFTKKDKIFLEKIAEKTKNCF